MIIVLIFGYHAKQYDWMPMPERNTFGYSFWLEVVTIFILFLGAMTYMICGVFKILRKYNPLVAERVADDMMAGRASTRYEDSGYIK